MARLLVLLAAVASSTLGVQGTLYGNKTGHPDYYVPNWKEVASCVKTVQVPGTPTCVQAAQYLGLTITALTALNPSLDCSKAYITPKTLICVPDGSSDGSSSSTNSSSSSGGSGTGGTGNSNSTASNSTISGSSSKSNVSSTATIAIITTTTTTAVAPASTAGFSATVDISSCISLFDTARSEYVSNQDGLTWSDNLASLAQQSADYSASSSCCDDTCHTLSGGSTGIAQNLYCGETSCDNAYDGWVTQEASAWGGHFANIVGYPVDYPYFGCAVSYSGVTAIYVAPSVTTTTTTTTTVEIVATTAAATTDDVLTTAETTTTTSDSEPAPAPQTQVDAPAAATTTTDAAVVAVASTTEAPAPAPQSQVDVPASTTTTTTDAVVVQSTTTAAAVSSGDIADPTIPSASDLPTPATNGCNGDNLSVCQTIAATDYQTAAAAAASVSSEFNQACLDLNNHARYLYGNPNAYLTWNEDLANWAVVSSAYANALSCWDCHSYSAGDLPWGQNLYVGESTCADAYYGWVTQEALGDGSGGEVGHFLNAAGWAVDPTGGTGYTQIGCGAYGNTIVCNYGLGDVSGALASLPIDYNTALTLALEGTVYSV
ncbi:hypothetical protein HK100_011771 [Physocladia obscura]|uniref:LysM domain-containing protein n=1 Tax=Physocladia obscura TaxID=109957 RepID=A0AAD5T9A7_9FUNG|nr:hypothetical protein HK100_011771 [Physocladia obscura]